MSLQDKIVSWDFLERVNLINKNYEQERGEKSTLSSQYSSIGLYCGAANQLVRSDYGFVCPDSGLILELLSYSFIGLSLLACWNAPLWTHWYDCPGYGRVLFYRDLFWLLCFIGLRSCFCFIGTFSVLCFIGLRFGLGDNFWLELFWLCFIGLVMGSRLLYPLTGSFYRASRYFVL